MFGVDVNCGTYIRMKKIFLFFLDGLHSPLNGDHVLSLTL